MGGNLIPVLDPDGKLLGRVAPHLNKLKTGGFTVEPLLFRFGDESIEIRGPEVTGQVYDSEDKAIAAAVELARRVFTGEIEPARTIKRLKWDEPAMTVGVADTLRAAAEAKIEHGDKVLLRIGDLRIGVKVQEGTLEHSLKEGEHLGVVRSIEGNLEEPLGLESGDLVAFERRHIVTLDKGAVEGGWT